MLRNESVAELGGGVEGLPAIVGRRAGLRPSPRQILCNQDMAGIFLGRIAQTQEISGFPAVIRSECTSCHFIHEIFFLQQFLGFCIINGKKKLANDVSPKKEAIKDLLIKGLQTLKSALFDTESSQV